MAYTLSADQITALTTEQTNLQATVNGYDTQAFIDSVNAGVVQAEEVDAAFEDVFDSFHSSVDGAQIRETEVNQLDGTEITDAIDDELDLLIEMGNIGPVIERITSATPTSIESSALIRININRFYPDADDKSDIDGSTATDVFPGPSWYALERGTETNVKTTSNRLGDTNTIFKASISPFTPSLSFSDSGEDIFIGDNERFLNYYTDIYLTSIGSSFITLQGVVNTLSNTTLVLVSGVQIGGVTTYQSTGTPGMEGDAGSGTAAGSNTVLEIGDVVRLDEVAVKVISVANSDLGNNLLNSNRGVVQFLKLENGTISSSPAISNGSSPSTSGLISDINSIKRFSLDQAGITSRISEILSEITSIYEMRYLAANSRANWNNGSLSLLDSKLSTRLNLLSPTNLLAAGLITQQEFDDGYVNEYTRTQARIDYIQSVLDGAS